VEVEAREEKVSGGVGTCRSGVFWYVCCILYDMTFVLLHRSSHETTHIASGDSAMMKGTRDRGKLSSRN
jgi:hypothetical protein